VPYQQSFEPFSKQLTIIIGLTVVGFMAFGLALSFYRNILFEQTLTQIAEQNQRIAMEIDEGYSDLEYYRSEQYRDKFGKENLGRLNPGESMLLLTKEPEAPPSSDEALTPTEQQEILFQEILRQMPVLEHWNIFLFHRDRIQELKMKL
jgi:hypothetical protein